VNISEPRKPDTNKLKIEITADGGPGDAAPSTATASASTPKASSATKPGGSLWHRLYHGTTNYDFVGKRKIGFIISGVLLVVTVLSLFTRGLNLGIDFEGGVAWEVPTQSATGSFDEDDAQAVLSSNAITDDAKVQTLSSTGGTDERLRIQVGDQPPEVQSAVRQAFADRAGVDVDDVGLNSVSSSWGEDITRKAVTALVVFFIALSIYVSIRFEWRMAVAAIAAVVHDVAISVGIYSLFGFEVAPATVIAFLTILGFSLYDTIVVFDKVHENSRRMLSVGSKVNYDDVVNLSMNQVLMRSINTSLAAVLPVLSLLVVGSWLLGARALQDFALALLVGLLTGSYSSIFIATPILAMLKRSSGAVRSDVNALRRSLDGDAVVARPAAAGPATVVRPQSTPTHPPRPRKQRR
jgi:preprotein translocase subunit SecF